MIYAEDVGLVPLSCAEPDGAAVGRGEVRTREPGIEGDGLWESALRLSSASGGSGGSVSLGTTNVGVGG